MVFPWFSQEFNNILMIFPCFPWFSHGFPMLCMIFPWLSHVSHPPIFAVTPLWSSRSSARKVSRAELPAKRRQGAWMAGSCTWRSAEKWEGENISTVSLYVYIDMYILYIYYVSYILEIHREYTCKSIVASVHYTRNMVFDIHVGLPQKSAYFYSYGPWAIGV